MRVVTREGIKWELGLSFLSGKVEFIAKIIKFCNSIDLKKLLYKTLLSMA